MKKLCVRVLLSIAVLLVCLACTGMVSLLVPFPHWEMTAVAVWYLFCLGTLCIPDET